MEVSVLKPLESKTMIGHRVAALPLCRFAASCVPESLATMAAFSRESSLVSALC